MVTAINLALGIVTTLMAYALGLPSPLLWGALAFVLNYIPYVGPAIMDVMLFAHRPVTYPTLARRAAAAGVFMAITLIEGHSSRRPSSAGSVLNLHPLAVFLSDCVLGLAVGTGRRVPRDADPDHRPRGAQPSLSARRRTAG